MPSAPMKLQGTLRVLLALVLLAVWQGSLLHPLQLCDAIAAVVTCISGSAQTVVGAIRVVESVHPREVVVLFGTPAPAYRSQAPPSLL